MAEFNFHKKDTFKPPPRLLPVLEKAKTVYKKWIETHRNLPRTQRFGIGSKTDFLFLELLELLRKAMYAPMQIRIELLQEASGKVDSIRFFFQLLWEAQLVPNNQYISLGSEIENLGKMIGGWKKGLVSKQMKPST